MNEDERVKKLEEENERLRRMAKDLVYFWDQSLETSKKLHDEVVMLRAETFKPSVELAKEAKR